MIANGILIGDDASALLDDGGYTATHRVAGCIILPLACLMEIAPVLFGRFSFQANHHMLKAHRYFGALLLAWVLGFQIWSGFLMIGKKCFCV